MKYISIIVSAILLISSFHQSLFCQVELDISKYLFQNVGMKDGFAQNTVYDIHQDNDGFMWFATPNGLYRYDGYEFEIFENDPYDSTTVSNNEVIKISESVNGHLWILNRNVLNRFDPQTKTFHRYPLKELGLQSYRTVYADKNKPNHIWIGTKENLGLIVLNEKSFEVEKIYYPIIENVKRNQYRDFIVRLLEQDSKGNMWVAYRNKLCRITEKDGDIKITHTGSHGFITCMELDSNDNLLVGYAIGASKVIITEDDLIYNTVDTRLKLLPGLSGERINQIISSNDGSTRLFSWENGIQEISADGELGQFYPTFKSIDKFNKGNFSKCYIDNTDVLWIGTYRGGLYKASLKRKPFYTIKAATANNTGLSDRFVNQISSDQNGNVWLGTINGGMNKIHIDGPKVKVFPDFNEKLGIEGDARCWGTLFDSKNNLWISVLGSGLIKVQYDKSGNRKKVSYFNSKDYEGFNIDLTYMFYEDQTGVVWMGNHNEHGIGYIDESGAEEKFIQLEHDKLNNLSVSAIYRDNKGGLWIGALNSGVFKVSLDENLKVLEVINIVHSNSNVEFLRSNPVFGFKEDSEGVIWMATFGAGLIKLMTNQISGELEFKYYQKKDGLPSAAVYSILEDDNKFLWLSTDEGISKFDPVKEVFQNFNFYDGLQNNNFRKWSAWKSKDGIMYFGGTNGFTYFDPLEVKSRESTSTVQITKMNVRHKKFAFQSFSYHASDSIDYKNNIIVLEPNQNTLALEFAALQFDNPHKSSYQYKLEGVDDRWIETSADKRYASYSFLKPGSYTFKVKSSNGDGVWNNEYAALNIYIQPYWYQTWWAILMYFVFIGLVVFIGLRMQYRRHKLRTQLEVEKHERTSVLELNKAKLSFFTNISHEIKTPLTIIAGLVDKNLSQIALPYEVGRDFGVIMKNTKRMLRLVSQLLDFRKVEAGHLPTNFVKSDLIAFLTELSESFEVFTAQRNIKFKFRAKQADLDVVFDPDKMEKIITNLVSNAFKYTNDGGEISLIVDSLENDLSHSKIPDEFRQASSDYIVLKISDNGKGIPVDQIDNIFDQFYQVEYHSSYKEVDKGSGLGLAFTNMLIKLQKGFVFVESELGAGSSFYVILPKYQQGFNEEEIKSDVHIRNVLNDVKEEFAPVAEEKIINVFKPEDHIQFHDKEILIVEDNVEIRAFLKDFLAPGFKVYEAENGVEGLKLAEERIPDLIISDVMMPEMDGYEMCSKIKENEKTNHIPIILLTANAQTEHRIEGIKAGADSYIPKPFNLEHLKIRIQKLLELRSKLKKKYIDHAGEQPLEEIDVNLEDKEFLKNLEGVIETNLSNSEYTVKDIEKDMGYSRMQLYRKLKSISDLSAVEFMRSYRLRRAVDMMHSTSLRVTEIAFNVGFTNVSYFGKCFKAKYGKIPSEFVKDVRSL
ncbi:response regulator [Labilibacter sediminis]|nr:response regulator [Labilibacter sediminis]